MSKFAWNTLKLTGGAGLAQVATILLTPWLTRIYSPEDFGVFGVFNSLLSLSVVVISMRYEAAIVLPRGKRQAANLLTLSMLISVAVTALLGTLFAIGGSWLFPRLNAPALKEYQAWLVVTIFFTGTLYMLNHWNVRTKRFEVVAGVNLMNAVLSNLSKVGLGLAGLANTSGLVYGNLAGTAAAWLAQALMFLRREGRGLGSLINIKEMAATASRYRKFPLFSSWSALLNNLSAQVPSFMLTGLFGPEVNGFYALGLRVLNLPSMLVGQALARVFFQSASEAAQEGRIARLVEKMMTKLINLGLFPILLLTLTGRDFFTVIFGATWSEAGVYTQILGLWTLAVFISSPISSLFSVFEKNEAGLAFNAVLLATRAASIYLGYLLGSARLALVFFSLSGAAAFIWLGAYMLRSAGANSARVARDTLLFLPYYAPLVVEAVLVQVMLRNRPMLIAANAAALGLIFTAIVIKYDPDAKALLSAITDKFRFFLKPHADS